MSKFRNSNTSLDTPRVIIYAHILIMYIENFLQKNIELAENKTDSFDFYRNRFTCS